MQVSDRICYKCAEVLGANIRDGSVRTMFIERCARCGKATFVCPAINYGIDYNVKDKSK